MEIKERARDRMEVRISNTSQTVRFHIRSMRKMEMDESLSFALSPSGF